MPAGKGGAEPADDPSASKIEGMEESGTVPFRVAGGMSRVDAVSQSWNGAAVRYFEKHVSPRKAWADMSSDLNTLVVLLDQQGGYVEGRLKLNRPTHRTRFDAGFAVWVPENRTVWGYSEHTRLVRDVRMSIDAGRTQEILGDDLRPSTLETPVPLLYDPRTTQIARLLADLCLTPAAGNRLVGEGLTTALLGSFFSACEKNPKKKRTGGLSSWQLRRSIEYLERNFSEDVSLAVIAEACGLSQSQFARAFAASTGMPPHQWAMRARVRSAQALLLRGDKPISAIASEIGFADQSHFTRVFKRFAGSTPARWQRAHKTTKHFDLG